MITTDAPKYTPQMGLDSLRVAGSAAAKRQNPSPWRMNSPSERSLERSSPSLLLSKVGNNGPRKIITDKRRRTKSLD